MARRMTFESCVMIVAKPGATSPDFREYEAVPEPWTEDNTLSMFTVTTDRIMHLTEELGAKCLAAEAARGARLGSSMRGPASGRRYT